MTTNEYLDSIEWVFGQRKETSASKNPSKSAAEVRKRVIVGFMILSWYVSPMYIHPLAVSFVTCKFVFIVNREVFELESKERQYLSACRNGAFRYAF